VKWRVTYPTGKSSARPLLNFCWLGGEGAV
jgi:hypothetical protein